MNQHTFPIPFESMGCKQVLKSIQFKSNISYKLCKCEKPLLRQFSPTKPFLRSSKSTSAGVLLAWFQTSEILPTSQILLKVKVESDQALFLPDFCFSSHFLISSCTLKQLTTICSFWFHSLI